MQIIAKTEKEARNKVLSKYALDLYRDMILNNHIVIEIIYGEEKLVDIEGPVLIESEFKPSGSFFINKEELEPYVVNAIDMLIDLCNRFKGN